jgi:hypothetical protein
MWARAGGPVVIAPDEGGLAGQLEHDVSGFYYPQGDVGLMTGLLERAIEMTEQQRNAMCRAAHERVATRNDLVQTLTKLLAAAWSGTSRQGQVETVNGIEMSESHQWTT